MQAQTNNANLQTFAQKRIAYQEIIRHKIKRLGGTTFFGALMFEILFLALELMFKAYANLAFLVIASVVLAYLAARAIGPYFYYRLIGQHEQATIIFNELKQQIVHNLPYIRKNLRGFIFGAVIGTLNLAFNIRFTMSVVGSLIAKFSIFKKFADLLKKTSNSPFKFVLPKNNTFTRLVVLYAPVFEEFLFRGLIHNDIKYSSLSQVLQESDFPFAQSFVGAWNFIANSRFVAACMRMCNFMIDKCKAVINYITGANLNNQPQPAPEIHVPAPQPNDAPSYARSAYNVASSALLFSVAHLSPQIPFAFVTGITLGSVYEAYDEPEHFAPTIGAHMANNLLAISMRSIL